MRATWLSKRDCAVLIAAVQVPFVIVYGISDNPRRCRRETISHQCWPWLA